MPGKKEQNRTVLGKLACMVTLMIYTQQERNERKKRKRKERRKGRKEERKEEKKPQIYSKLYTCQINFRCSLFMIEHKKISSGSYNQCNKERKINKYCIGHGPMDKMCTCH